MRVMLSTFGSRGDVEPVVALAVRLRELGAEVAVSAPPDFAETLAGVGVPLVAIGPPVRSFVGGDRPPTPADALKLAAGLLDERFGTIAKAAEGCDVLLATGLMPAGIREVAGKLGVPYVFASLQTYGLPARHYGDDVTDTRRERDEAAVQRANMLYGEPLNAHRAALGLPPVDNVRDHVYTERPWLAADPVLNDAAHLIGVVQTGAWILPDSRPLSPELESFLDAGEPPVYVGFGSMPMRSADTAHVAVEAVRAQGRRVLLASGWADLAATDDGDDYFVVGEVNQQVLFTRVAGVVHHGGAGTTTTAARAGAPQVVVAQMGDQPDFADRVAELGIGVAHDGPVPTVASLSEALATALAPAMRTRAAEVAGTIRADGADTAARLLFKLAGKTV